MHAVLILATVLLAIASAPKNRVRTVVLVATRATDVRLKETIPSVCKEEEEEQPCEPQRIRCNCIGELECPCDIGEPSDLPIVCPCEGEAECLCDPCGVEIVRDEDESPDDGVIERPTGSHDGGSPDDTRSSEDTEIAGIETEPTSPPVDNIAAFPEPTSLPIEPTNPPIEPTNPPSLHDEENISNDEGQADLDATGGSV